MQGSDENDEISGRREDDLIFGNEGNDVIEGDQGNDVILGGDGDDTIIGGLDNDIMLGGNGNDTLLLDFGKDQAYGGPGDDTFIAKDGGDYLTGGTSGENGNTFIIDNTSQNGETRIRDFWLNENSTIVGRDADCEFEVTFTHEELKHCMENDPVLNISNQECVVSTYYETPVGEAELCMKK